MSRRPRILVINPNSNDAVTKGLEAALAPLGFKDGPEIVCVTLKEGPFGVETQADAESVTLPLRRIAALGDSVADCAEQLKTLGLRPAEFEFSQIKRQ